MSFKTLKCTREELAGRVPYMPREGIFSSFVGEGDSFKVHGFIFFLALLLIRIFAFNT